MENIQAEQIAMGQLESGERLLWSGSPSPGALAVSSIPLALMGIPFLAFSCFWVWMALRGTAHAPGPFLLFPLFGLSFVLVGLGIVGSPVLAWFSAKYTVYAVTEKRALIIGSFGVRKVRSFSHAQIGDITRMERSDGSGTLWFATREYVTSDGSPRSSRIGFVGIPDVRQVEQLIRDNLVETKAA